MIPARRNRSSIALTLGLLAPLTAAAGNSDPFADYGGAELFGRFCASCHGSAARGDGPVASSLKVVVPDLTGLAGRHAGRFPEERVREIIDGRAVLPAHGSRLMPVWGYEFEARAGERADVASPRAEAQALIDRLVEYLRSLQR
jgi:mono/diheme cytochrome c family protein